MGGERGKMQPNCLAHHQLILIVVVLPVTLDPERVSQSKQYCSVHGTEFGRKSSLGSVLAGVLL